jgi:hypothetical protein
MIVLSTLGRDMRELRLMQRHIDWLFAQLDRLYGKEHPAQRSRRENYETQLLTCELAECAILSRLRNRGLWTTSDVADGCKAEATS